MITILYTLVYVTHQCSATMSSISTHIFLKGYLFSQLVNIFVLFENIYVTGLYAIIGPTDKMIQLCLGCTLATAAYLAYFILLPHIVTALVK